ncbi:Alpha-L-fucosidase [Pseudopedobacter saltans DSM 12145]|uniref:Alpha-L-fucosidase n=1 Tax=Pseudopedobacter saltans (strain ATCC 51119 / DSM 12145 / JCM 21818 / CCUG 39354 / LMG 10337 / NBRC 100064 / NCIMB 13643) TaxID=762903 RepID=F0S4C5_PSESL|nr:glycoside hydrolase N-terminal domain-containing protein [Pseudopedobacter saltans]ADY50882.1 Alpha-L-fucosidase [Pseudopedobacter saltans DSM 12145]
MNKTALKAILICLGLGSTFVSQAQQSKNVLWYKQPAKEWTEALPIGNGKIGAMIFGGVAQDRIQFNEETLWTGSPRNYNKPDAYKYLPQIRTLLQQGKQREAEALAMQEFMGLKSEAGDKEAWLKEIEKTRLNPKGPAAASFNDKAWKGFYVPTYEGWETLGLEGLDGALWFRTQFTLPANWKGQDLILDLNKIRQVDYTYINGHLVGHSEGDDVKRNYTIPAKYLKPGKNMVAVQVINFIDKGGISGYKDTTQHIGVFPKGKSVKEGISLNGNWKYWVQDDNPPAPAVYQASYQPFGDIYLNFKHQEYTNYKRELDLNSALAKTSYSHKGTNYTRTYFVNAPQNTLVIHLEANQPKNVTFTASFDSPHSQKSIRKIDDRTIALDVKVKYGALFGESILHLKNKNGKISVKNNQLVVEGADEATLMLFAATNFVNFHDVSGKPSVKNQQTLASAKNLDYQTLKQNHLQDYTSLYNRFSLSFGGNSREDLPTDERIREFSKTANDPALLALYAQYGRYLLISSSRANTQPANLQGIWNHLLAPSWGSKYTTNINVEMNYWLSEMLNLSDLHQPLFGMIEDLSKSGAETAKNYYNLPGWVLHHNTDIWRGAAPINNSNHGIWPTGGAWLTTHLLEHYAFTKDQAFLKKYYPIIKNSVLFYKDFLVVDPISGCLISTPSNSPEHGGLVAGPTMDHQIIRALFDGFVNVSAALGLDEDLRKEIQTKKQQILPNKIGKYGQLQEWMVDVDDRNDKHRHVSHLWALHPGNEINWETTPDLLEATKQTLKFRGDDGTGWSLAWKINFWARLRDGEHTYKMMQMLLAPAGKSGGSYPNLFDAHPPFQIDGNFGGAAGIAEMLVQSHTSFIEILPALPRALQTGEVKGLKARGGFELDFSWSKGKLQKLTVKSLAGGNCRLKVGTLEKDFKTEKGKVYTFDGGLQKL